MSDENTVIGALRCRVRQMLPAALRDWVLREMVPGVTNWVAKVVQGIDPIFDHDPAFSAVYERCGSRSLIDRKKAYVLFNIAHNLKGRPGALAELGVYRGATAKLLLEVVGPDREFYGFDTFEGLPEPDKENDPFWTKGELSETSLEEARNFIGGGANTHLIKGFFPDSTASVPGDPRFAFVHIDADLYRPTVDACAWFYPRLLPGALILVDDYGYLSCPGVRKAVDEFFADKPEKPIFIPSGQALIVKQ